MKTRTRLVVEIVALVAAAALFAVAYRLRYYGSVFGKACCPKYQPCAKGMGSDYEIKTECEASDKATATFNDRIGQLTLAYVNGDYDAFTSLTNDVFELSRQVRLEQTNYSKLQQAHFDHFRFRETWPSFADERELDAFLKLHLEAGKFICEILCQKKNFSQFVDHEECDLYRQLALLKSKYETEGHLQQVQIVEKHRLVLVGQIDSKSGFTRRWIEHLAAWYAKMLSENKITKTDMRLGLRSRLYPLIEEGYTPKWVGEIDGLVDRVEDVKREKADRP